MLGNQWHRVSGLVTLALSTTIYRRSISYHHCMYVKQIECIQLYTFNYILNTHINAES